MTPLETIASVLIRYDSLLAPSKDLFDAYNRFLGLMASDEPLADGKTPREHLDALEVGDLENDSLYREAREIRQAFGKAVEEIFLRPTSQLYDLTVRYGVF